MVGGHLAFTLADTSVWGREGDSGTDPQCGAARGTV